ncbi:hypothetical protein GGI16_006227, partial [Coemansia sp. S142-1]
TQDTSRDGTSDSNADEQDLATTGDSAGFSTVSEEQTLADDSYSVTESFDASYEETGLPGAVSLNTPNYMAIPTPMFEIGSNVVLGWSYSNDTLRPPAKVSICGRYPSDFAAFQARTGLCDWVVASNLSGGTQNYTWDTVTQGAPGYSFYADTGYMMYIYDGDFGIGNLNPGAGRITPFAFTFSMYNSQYGNTNQGVPTPPLSGNDACPLLFLAAPSKQKPIMSCRALDAPTLAIVPGDNKASFSRTCTTAPRRFPSAAIASPPFSRTACSVLLGVIPRVMPCALGAREYSTTTNKGNFAAGAHPAKVDDKGNGSGDNRDLTVNIGGATAPTAASSGFGISLNNGGDSTPSKTGSSKSPSSTGSGSSNGQPGRITMKTPPQSVASPLFEIASTVQLQWDYDNNMKKPPSQITIRGQMPSGFFQPGTTKPLYWYIAQNVSAAPKSYNWNTITESPPGYTLREGSGYKLFIYDSDIGWDNSTHVYPGKLFQFMLPFSMYNSRYAQSNDGVPKNYNPNAAPRSASAGTGVWMAMLAATTAGMLLL